MTKKLIFLVAIFAFGTIAVAGNEEAIKSLWLTWKIKHNKTFPFSEELKRFKIFAENVKRITSLNAESKGVKYAINKFADLTPEEFKRHYINGGFSGDFTQKTNLRRFYSNLPEHVDWREKGAVTPVKNQGACGSCWAFSTTGVLEGFYYIKNGHLKTFSQQQILDCARDAGLGCFGGWPYKAIEYACKNGLQLESDYPYVGRDGKCKYNQTKSVQVCKGYQLIAPKNSEALKAALVEAPVAVLVEADQLVFQFYSSGVVSIGCGADLDHAVLAVGYKKVGNLELEAFIVKNSWGVNWGAEGYIYISTIQQFNNGQGACGILAQPVFPT